MTSKLSRQGKAHNDCARKSQNHTTESKRDLGLEEMLKII